ncbi:MAG: acyl-CoA thioesterase-1 [Crocinitomix sp.]|jgi:acyl-CoA thioesterase-1
MKKNRIFLLRVPTFILSTISFTALFAMCATTDLPETEPENTELNYLALGDSYTIGESVANEKIWPNLLVDALSEKEMLTNSTTIIAETGWRTDNMLAAAEDELDDKKFEIISLLIGVNNEFQGQDPSDFEPEFIECLTYAIAHCENGAAGVFVVSIPDYGYTPYGESNQAAISARIDLYNEICERNADNYQVPFYNITPISRNGLDQPDLVASDGLHPSGKQYGLWVDQFSNEVFELFNP